MCITTDIPEAQNLGFLFVPGILFLNCLENFPESGMYSAVVIAVAHKQFKALKVGQLRKLLKKNGILYDIKSIFSEYEVDGSL